MNLALSTDFPRAYVQLVASRSLLVLRGIVSLLSDSGLLDSSVILREDRQKILFPAHYELI